MVLYMLVLYMLGCICYPASTNTADDYVGPFLLESGWPAQSDSKVFQSTSDLQLVNAGACRVIKTRGHMRRTVCIETYSVLVATRLYVTCLSAPRPSATSKVNRSMMTHSLTNQSTSPVLLVRASHHDKDSSREMKQNTFNAVWRPRKQHVHAHKENNMIPGGGGSCQRSSTSGSRQ